MKLGKVSVGRERWYDDACGTALAMDLVGERWSLLILRELMFGPRRFGELRAALRGLSANILTQRVAGLEASGILARRRLPPPASAQVYELTRWGYESEPMIRALGRWAIRSPDHDPTLPLSAAALMMSFRTMLAAERPPGLTLRVAFRLGADAFVAAIDRDGIAVARGEARDADVTFTGAPAAVAAVVYGGRALDDAIASGDLAVAGSRAMARLFARLFPLPPKVGVERAESRP